MDSSERKKGSHMHWTKVFNQTRLRVSTVQTLQTVIVLHNTFKGYGHWLPLYYRGNQFHHRGNPARGHSIPTCKTAVFPQYYRHPHYGAGL